MATHPTKGHNAVLYCKKSGDATYRILQGAKNYKLPGQAADKIETTNMLSPSGFKQYENGLRDPGQFSATVQLNMNTSAGAVTGENVLNGIQADMFDDVGGTQLYNFIFCLPKTGAYPSSFTATPPTDRPYYTFSGTIADFPVDVPQDMMETEITVDVVGKVVLTRVP